LEDRSEEALEARLLDVAVAMAAALRNDEFFADPPERGNMAKEEMKVHAN
jgi:hypothetical protein